MWYHQILPYSAIIIYYKYRILLYTSKNILLRQHTFRHHGIWTSRKVFNYLWQEIWEEIQTRYRTNTYVWRKMFLSNRLPKFPQHTTRQTGIFVLRPRACFRSDIPTLFLWYFYIPVCENMLSIRKWRLGELTDVWRGCTRTNFPTLTLYRKEIFFF